MCQLPEKGTGEARKKISHVMTTLLLTRKRVPPGGVSVTHILHVLRPTLTTRIHARRYRARERTAMTTKKKRPNVRRCWKTLLLLGSREYLAPLLRAKVIEQH